MLYLPFPLWSPVVTGWKAVQAHARAMSLARTSALEDHARPRDHHFLQITPKLLVDRRHRRLIEIRDPNLLDLCVDADLSLCSYVESEPGLRSSSASNSSSYQKYREIALGQISNLASNFETKSPRSRCPSSLMPRSGKGTFSQGNNSSIFT